MIDDNDETENVLPTEDPQGDPEGQEVEPEDKAFDLPDSVEPVSTSYESFDAGDFGFIEHYGEEISVQHDEQLPDNEAVSALNCAFIGVGGAGGKLAKAFLDLGFNKTLLLNTTEKDQPEGVEPEHLILIPDADGVAKM